MGYIPRTEKDSRWSQRQYWSNSNLVRIGSMLCGRVKGLPAAQSAMLSLQTENTFHRSYPDPAGGALAKETLTNFRRRIFSLHPLAPAEQPCGVASHSRRRDIRIPLPQRPPKTGYRRPFAPAGRPCGVTSHGCRRDIQNRQHPPTASWCCVTLLPPDRSPPGTSLYQDGL